eukprot:589271-Amphidinium_carterae.1
MVFGGWGVEIVLVAGRIEDWFGNFYDCYLCPSPKTSASPQFTTPNAPSRKDDRETETGKKTRRW